MSTTADARPSRALLFLLIGLMALGEGASQLLIPALPDAAASLRATPAAVQATFSAFAAALGLSQLVAGPVADRFGRRPMLLGGLTLFVLGTLGALAADRVELLVLARVLQGVGASAGVVGARAIARDVWREAAPRAVALTVFGMMIALMAAPVVGGLLTATFGWRSVLVLTAAVALAVLAAVALGYRETRPVAADAPRAHWASAYAEVLTHRRFLAYALALGATYGVLFAYISGGAYVLGVQFHLSAAGAGATTGFILTGLVAGTLLASRLVPHHGPAKLTRLGTAVTLVGALAAAAATASPSSLALFLAPQCLITLGAGLVLPCAVAGAVMPFGAKAGVASGVLGCLQMVMGAGFGLLVGRLADGSAGPLVGVQAIAATLAFLGLWALLPVAVPRPQEAP